MNGAFGFICAIFLFYTLKSNRFINIYLAIMVLGISFRLVLKGYLELTGQFDIILETSKNNIHLLMTSFPFLIKTQNLITKHCIIFYYRYC
jgi:hypothetical protein